MMQVLSTADKAKLKEIYKEVGKICLSEFGLMEFDIYLTKAIRVAAEFDPDEKTNTLLCNLLQIKSRQHENLSSSIVEDKFNKEMRRLLFDFKWALIWYIS